MSTSPVAARPSAKRRHGCVALVDGDAAGAEGEVRVAEGATQRVMQICAVEMKERRAPTGDSRLGQRNAAEQRAAAPVAQIEGQGADANRAQRVGEPEGVEDFDRVGTDGDAGANLAQHASLLEDVGIDPGPLEGEGGREAPNAAPDDKDAHGRSFARCDTAAGQWVAVWKAKDG